MTNTWEETSGFVQDLGEAARGNPLAAMLIGAGVLWLFGERAVQAAEAIAGRAAQDPGFARDRGQSFNTGGAAFDATRSNFKAGARSLADNVSSATDTVQSGASAALQGARRYGREQADTVAEYARSVPQAGTEMIDSLRSSLSEVFEAQPLALGAIGLAIGAGIAAALPPTKLELDYLGESSATVKEKAAQFASEKAARARTIAEEAVSAVADEARRQGLTVEGAKSAAGEISEKASRVADAARKGVSERTGADR